MREIDYGRRLVDYFKKNLSKGYTLETLRWALTNQGYSRIELMKAAEQANKELAAKAPILNEKPIIKYEAFDQEDKLIKIKKSFWKRFFRV